MPVLTVFYDGRCPLCLRSVRWLRRLDWLHRLEILNLHEPDVLAKITIPLDQLMREMHVRTAKGDVHRGFFAFRRIARELPLLLPLYPLLWLPGAARLGSAVYAHVARHRGG